MKRRLDEEGPEGTLDGSEGVDGPKRHTLVSDSLIRQYGPGARIMAAMGFVEGQGLGKHGQGILEPIQTYQRPKGMGLGAIRERGDEYSDDESDEEGVAEFVPEGMKFELQKLPDAFELIEELEREGYEVPMEVKERADNGNGNGNDANNRDLRLLLQTQLEKIKEIRTKQRYMAYELAQMEQMTQLAREKADVLEKVLAVLKTGAQGDSLLDQIAATIDTDTSIDTDGPVLRDPGLYKLLMTAIAPTIKELFAESSETLYDELESLSARLEPFRPPVDAEYGQDDLFKQVVAREWIPVAEAVFNSEEYDPSVDATLGPYMIQSIEPFVPRSVLLYVLQHSAIPKIVDTLVHGHPGESPDEWQVEWVVDWFDVLEDDMLEEVVGALFQRYGEWIRTEWDTSQPLYDYDFLLDYCVGSSVDHTKQLQEALLDRLVKEARHDRILNPHRIGFSQRGVYTSVDTTLQTSLLNPWWHEFVGQDSDEARLQLLINQVAYLRHFHKYPSVKHYIEKAFDFLNDKNSAGITDRLQRVSLADADSISSASWQPPLTIKEITEQYCDTHNLFLSSSGGMNDEGKVLYTVSGDLGARRGLPIYFENDIVWAKPGQSSSFEPVSVRNLQSLC